MKDLFSFHIPDGALRDTYTFSLPPELIPADAAQIGTTAGGIAVFHDLRGRTFTLVKVRGNVERRPYDGPVLEAGAESAEVAAEFEPTQPTTLAGLDFASAEAAEMAATLSAEAIERLRASEPSSKKDYTKADVLAAAENPNQEN